METRRWINQSQPQTLQIAVFLLYFRAVFSLLFGLDAQVAVALPAAGLLRVALPVGMAAGAFGIANDKRWGYRLAVAVAVVPLACRLLLGVGFTLSGTDIGAVSPLAYDPLGLVFEVALAALLLHPQSREHQRIWFS